MNDDGGCFLVNGDYSHQPQPQLHQHHLMFPQQRQKMISINSNSTPSSSVPYHLNQQHQQFYIHPHQQHQQAQITFPRSSSSPSIINNNQHLNFSNTQCPQQKQLPKSQVSSTSGSKQQHSTFLMDPSMTSNLSSSILATTTTKNAPTSSTPSSSSPSSTTRATATSSSSHIHLWQFLKELLEQPQQFGSAIRWLERSKGVFKIEDSVRVAKLWGARKNRPMMNYDKLSRSIRQYYKKGIMKKTERSQRLVYQFCAPYSM